jgi:hypothetical protein
MDSAPIDPLAHRVSLQLPVASLQLSEPLTPSLLDRLARARGQHDHEWAATAAQLTQLSQLSSAQLPQQPAARPLSKASPLCSPTALPLAIS